MQNREFTRLDIGFAKCIVFFDGDNRFSFWCSLLSVALFSRPTRNRCCERRNPFRQRRPVQLDPPIVQTEVVSDTSKFMIVRGMCGKRILI